MSTLVDFTIAPMDKGESVSPYVARAVAIIRDSGLPYRLGPMATTIEGAWDVVMAVITRCFEALAPDCNRISISLKVDYRKNAADRLQGKLDSVRHHLADLPGG
jgi:uncharacterized protein (TIGR00106 family)